MVVINGTTGIDKVQDGSIIDADLNLSVKPMCSIAKEFNQIVTAGLAVKVMFDTKVFDTTNAYDSVTNYRFQPTKAGYYFVSSTLRHDTTAATSLMLYRNGLLYSFLQHRANYTASDVICGSYMIYLNGTSDYLEIFTSIASGTPTITGNGVLNIFQAHYIGV